MYNTVIGSERLVKGAITPSPCPECCSEHWCTSLAVMNAPLLASCSASRSRCRLGLGAGQQEAPRPRHGPGDGRLRGVDMAETTGGRQRPDHTATEEQRRAHDAVRKLRERLTA